MADTKRKQETARPLEAEEEVRRDAELREEKRVSGERIQQQIVNQGGMDTGTHSSSHRGVDWSPAYRLRPELGKSSPSKRQQIEMRAYEIYVQRGSQDGHDLDDWLKAEEELGQD